MDAVEQRSDRELLTGHLAGDATAFSDLTEKYARDLFGFLIRFVGSAAAAEDLVQETFLQVHVAAQSFDVSRPFKPWLYTIAANKARDMLRSRGRRQERSLDATAGNDESGLSLAAGLEAGGAAVSDESDKLEQRDAVRAQIARMPEHLRLILTLGYYQQLPYAEISEILDIPVGTVKSRLHSAVRHFARLWASRSAVIPKANRRESS